jgi:hypothetical protein
VVLQEWCREKHLGVRGFLHNAVFFDNHIAGFPQLLDRPAAKRHHVMRRCGRAFFVHHREARSVPPLEMIHLMDELFPRVQPRNGTQRLTFLLPDGEDFESLIPDHSALAATFDCERIQSKAKREIPGARSLVRLLGRQEIP